ncbi:MAG: MBL fold metallo-hydrolase [Bacteroidota bacterium]|nr:MBL fold metallo-hydrolase [Bacteroidota bacterium]MDP4259525.1 MBL fold metallo-hydrolase [Bacteroidota bacterium]
MPYLHHVQTSIVQTIKRTTMQRRNFILNAALSLGALSLEDQRLFAAGPAGRRRAGQAEDPWKMRPLRRDVGIFTEKGGTIAWLVSKKGIVVVDAEFPEQAGHLIGELKKQSDQPFELLINTHHHGDHTAGNIAFKGLVKDVAAHGNSLANQQRVAVAQKTEDKQLYPNITYTDGWNYRIGHEHIRAYYFGPGHTNGDSIIHFQHANVAHMGDLMFNRRWAFIDRSAGASISNWIVALDKAIHTFDSGTLFVFGHAFDPEKVTGGKEDLKAMQNYLTQLQAFANQAFHAGRSKEDFVKEKAIPGVTEWQGDGIERGLQAAYEEVAASQVP